MRRLRFLIACLLMLALPLQGMAAASMLPCGSQAGHPHAAGASPVHGHTHEHGGGRGHHHASQDSASADPAQHAPGDLHDAKCSACASCCHGAAVATALQVPAFSVPAYAAAPVSTVALLLRATPPPDKPPRA